MGRRRGTPTSRWEELSLRELAWQVLAILVVGAFAIVVSAVAVTNVWRWDPLRANLWQIAWLLTPLAVAVIGWIALIPLLTVRSLSTFLLLVVGAFAALFASYVLWVELRSPLLQQSIVWLACVEIVGAVVLLASVWRTRRVSLTRNWRDVLPLLTALAGIAIFWFNGYYLPAHARPDVDVATSLQASARVGDSVAVSATIVVKNSGDTDVQVPQSYFSVEGIRRQSQTQACKTVGVRTHRIRREGLLSSAVVIPPNRTWQQTYGLVVDARRYCAVTLSATLIAATDYTVFDDPRPTTCDGVVVRDLLYPSTLEQYLNDDARMYVAQGAASTRCPIFDPWKREAFQVVRYPLSLEGGLVANLDHLKVAIPTLRVSARSELVLLDTPS
jgi:hypothetical protein